MLGGCHLIFHRRGEYMSKTLNFNVEAISVPIVYNKYGDHDPNGMMYVLQEDVDDIKQDAYEKFHMYPPQPSPKVVPLVLRCHEGDTVVIHYKNSIRGIRTSMHVQGLNYNVLDSDGASVGFNPDTTTSDEITYTWYADKVGTYLFSDLADPTSGESTNIHGLFGAILVECPQSKWFHPVTGCRMNQGLFADIYPCNQKAFREYTVFFQDELAIVNKDRKQPIDPHTGLVSSTMGISYRSEPMRNRIIENPVIPMEGDSPCGNHFPAGHYPMNHSEHEHQPGHEEHILVGEDVSMSSWTFGDPSTFLLNAYVGDPCTMKLLHAGVKETHVMHVHNHQWRLVGKNPSSTIIDSQSISPQECYELEFLYGAGSLTKTIGDVIWHCHLYPHFMEGMWGLWRIHDRYEDGTGFLPDGTPIPALQPLLDRPFPPFKDELHPGYPNFLEGEVGIRPSQPALGILNPDGSIQRIPTQLEEDNFIPGAVPGSLYSRTCRKQTICPPDVVFEIAVLQADLCYNDFGWHDPQGRFLVLREEIENYGGVEQYIELVNDRKIKVEPLIIRAHAGDCIEVRFTNLLPLFLNSSRFEPKTLTDICGFHIHLVKFDTITSDGSANGWCNIAGAYQCQTLIERFYADEELNTVFFHDHLFPNSHQQHGLFGALIIEPKGSTFHDIRTGEPIRSGTKAIITRANKTQYREFALAVHDFAYLFDRHGKPLNPPEVPGSHDDPGVMGVNYRCEPLRERLKNPQNDPAYIYSSIVHGDPATPILETYPGDEMVIRLFQGAQEEQHCFNIVGMQWQKEFTNPRSPITASQSLGISEAFNIRICEYYEDGDYMYHFGGIDDIWLGVWGIIRAYGKRTSSLLPIRNAFRSQTRFMPSRLHARTRHYEIAAIKTDIPYNKYGDHDPDGLLFVPLHDVETVQSGLKSPKPLILRANKGDCIKVTLYNYVDKVKYFDYPSVPLEMKHTPSNRVSISPQFLRLHNIEDSGVNIGYNPIDQTIAPGDSKTYTWYADKEYGTCILNSYGDLRNHRYHGLFGAIIIEPQYATWRSKSHDQLSDYAEQAMIYPKSGEAFCENVVFIQNGIRLLNHKDQLILSKVDGEIVDDEDTGEKGYNYRSERFYNRFKTNDEPSLVFNSYVHGDPSTPIFTANTGQRVVFRTLMAADKPRNVSFALHGHMWKEHPFDPCSRIIPLQGHISVGNVFDMELREGASLPGDYLYRSGSLRWDIESGMWGIFRVSDRPINCNCQRYRNRFVCRFRRLYHRLAKYRCYHRE